MHRTSVETWLPGESTLYYALHYTLSPSGLKVSSTNLGGPVTDKYATVADNR